MGSAAMSPADAVGGPKKRARPPEWPKEVREVFFDDARAVLVGPRPDYGQSANVSAIARDAAPPATEVAGRAAMRSRLIDAETIEAEIKRLAQAAASDVATPSQFKGGTFKECRRNFSVLAVLFAVAAEYEGTVRWSDVAPALRDQFARAGYNCKVGTDQTYRESSQRSQELAELIRGSRPQVASAERAADWGQVADRPPLMQRLEIAHQERLTKWLANEREFAQHRDDVRHEAQLVATLADVIGGEGFEYWDDEQYAQNARELRQAATDIAAAAERENYEQAKQAIGRATNACTNCHEGYRG
jgi:cytochrome c556